MHSFFKHNIWSADLAHIQLISKFNSWFRFLLCVINIFSQYAWVIPLKDKESTTITNAFQKILDESNRKTTKVWVDKGTNFIINQPNHGYRNNFKKMYPTNNDGKSVVAERFIRSLKNKIYKYINSISKNAYVDKSDDRVDKYNKTYHRTIKMKPVHVNPSIYIVFKKEHKK